VTPGAANRNGLRVTGRSVRGSDFGLFLSEVFDGWIRRDVGVMFIPFFDAVLESYLCVYSTVCVLRPAWGDELVLDHYGDIYSCDH